MLWQQASFCICFFWPHFVPCLFADLWCKTSSLRSNLLAGADRGEDAGIVLRSGTQRFHKRSFKCAWVGSSYHNSRLVLDASTDNVHKQHNRKKGVVSSLHLCFSDENYSSVSNQTKIDKPTITFVTGNKNKLEEVKQIIHSSTRKIVTNGSSRSAAFPFDLINQEIDLPELQGDDPIAIAREKCRMACDEVGGPVITEDTSLCFNALHGLPGPYIKWFLAKCGHEGLNNMIAFSPDKSAYAQTVFAFCLRPGSEVLTFDGRTQGTIVPARGPKNFGWDPIFEPVEGNGLTYAEMTKEAKNAISHRSRSLELLTDYFYENAQTISNSEDTAIS